MGRQHWWQNCPLYWPIKIFLLRMENVGWNITWKQSTSSWERIVSHFPSKATTSPFTMSFACSCPNLYNFYGFFAQQNTSFYHLLSVPANIISTEQMIGSTELNPDHLNDHSSSRINRANHSRHNQHEIMVSNHMRWQIWLQKSEWTWMGMAILQNASQRLTRDAGSPPIHFILSRCTHG